MKIQELKNKKILIVGAGKEGNATLAFLRFYLPEEIIDIVDQNDGPDYLKKVNEYDVVIKSPGINPSVLIVKYTSASNIFFANVKGKTIGVTGTKGKSTTTSLIYSILHKAGLKAHLVGNIGNPMLSELLKTNQKDDIWVCELSSFMTGDLKYSPDISVILNLFPEHMDYHGNVKSYYEAKKNILTDATSEDYFIYNPEIPDLIALSQKTKAKAIPFIEVLPFDEGIIPLLGKHNVVNVKAAVTVAKILKVEDKDIETTVRNFKPLRHRLENIGTFHGITFYDDAISTTPESTIKAIEALKNIGTIFLGGQDRGYDFSELAKVIVEIKIPNLVLFPQSGDAILSALKEKTQELPNIYKTDNHKDAIVFAYKHTKPGTICLMSPASPSYSLWKNFEERGNEFQMLVKEYGK